MATLTFGMAATFRALLEEDERQHTAANETCTHEAYRWNEDNAGCCPTCGATLEEVGG